MIRMIKLIVIGMLFVGFKIIATSECNPMIDPPPVPKEVTIQGCQNLNGPCL